MWIKRAWHRALKRFSNYFSKMPGFGKREDKPSPPIGAMEKRRWKGILTKKIGSQVHCEPIELG